MPHLGFVCLDLSGLLTPIRVITEVLEGLFTCARDQLLEKGNETLRRKGGTIKKATFKATYLDKRAQTGNKCRISLRQHWIMKAIKTHNWIYRISSPWCIIKMLFPRNWRYPNLYCRLITALFRTAEGEFSSVKIAWILMVLNFLNLIYCQEIINITFNNFRYFWFWTPLLLFIEFWLQKKHTQHLYLDSVYKGALSSLWNLHKNRKVDYVVS